jgi:hypothetical protein
MNTRRRRDSHHRLRRMHEPERISRALRRYVRLAPRRQGAGADIRALTAALHADDYL